MMINKECNALEIFFKAGASGCSGEVVGIWWCSRAWLLVRGYVRRKQNISCLVVVLTFFTSILSQTAAFAQVVDTPEWVVAAPWRSPSRSGTPAFFAQELSAELSVPVKVEEKIEGGKELTLAWSLANVKERPILLFLSDELVLTQENPEIDSPRNLSHYEPLALIWLTRWCLFSSQGIDAKAPTPMLDWLQKRSNPPHIAIPEEGGRMSVWVKGMEVRTQRKWQVSTYGLGGSVATALKQGADVALGYCSRQKMHPDDTRILLQSTSFREKTQRTDARGWLPIHHGWVAWAAPKQIPSQQRDAMAAALYRVMGKPHVQTRLQAAGHFFEYWTPAQTRNYVESFTASWINIRKLLDSADEEVVARP